ncbi:outer membrane protein assembly factor BamC [Methylomicrobium lacus]|uniref:outer membrane protein assembly factor BamC n=1 Tax=Methylomicrobium lacus TaxID=136992 RepID=UPI0035A89767
MRLRSVYLFAYLWLAACASDDARYRDTSALEKPPTLVIEKPEAAEEEPDKAEADKPAEEGAAAAGDEDQEDAEPKPKKGLGDAVSISGAPPVLTIKQSFDVAWNSLKQALIQSGIEVTDLEHDKGKFYVVYDADSYASEHGSLLEKSVGLFSGDYAKQGFLLTLTAEGSATKVTAVPAKDAEYRKRTDRDDEVTVADSDEADKDQPTDGADKLLNALYLTLKEDLREN